MGTNLDSNHSIISQGSLSIHGAYDTTNSTNSDISFYAGNSSSTYG